MDRDLSSGQARPPQSPARPRLRAGVVLAGAVLSVLCITITGLLLAGTAFGRPLARTVWIRDGAHGAPNGSSSSPEISGDGRFVAFASLATNLGPPDPNGHVSDVYLYDRTTGVIGLISAGLHGQGADGPSAEPALAAGAKVVVFASTAHNLIAADNNPHTEVFAWVAGVGIVRVSASSTGAAANGDAAEPDVSADGRLVTFVSTATNLVPGDTGGHANVYVRDLLTSRTYLISAAQPYGPANGDSRAPAISSDGGSISFFSSASNLVPGDVNGKPDVFVRNLSTGAMALASVSGAGTQQNAAVPAPFVQLSDVSNGGRFVVFDSDATNLVPGDRNRHTDIFVRDTVLKTTSRASLATTDQESNNDSFAPRISADGRFVSFESFAGNLAPYVPAGPNIFVRDRVSHTTVMADVSASGRVRSPEHVGQLLQRPSISDDGAVAAFSSSADNLSGSSTGLQNIFLRGLFPPPITRASPKVGVFKGHVVIGFVSRDPQAGPLLCRLDRRPVALCPLGITVLPRLRRGRHVLYAFPGGQGTAYASRPITVRMLLRGRRSRVTVSNPR